MKRDIWWPTVPGNFEGHRIVCSHDYGYYQCIDCSQIFTDYQVCLARASFWGRLKNTFRGILRKIRGGV